MKKKATARIPHWLDRHTFMDDCETVAAAIETSPSGFDPEVRDDLVRDFRHPAVETLISSLDAVLWMDNDRPILSDDARAAARRLLCAIKRLTKRQFIALCSAA